MNEAQAYKYLQLVQIGLPDGETVTEEGWVIRKRNGKLDSYIEPLEENAFAKLIYDSSRGAIIETGTRSHNFGHSEEGLDHAKECMAYIEKHQGKWPHID